MPLLSRLACASVRLCFSIPWSIVDTATLADSLAVGGLVRKGRSSTLLRLPMTSSHRCIHKSGGYRSDSCVGVVCHRFAVVSLNGRSSASIKDRALSLALSWPDLLPSVSAPAGLSILVLATTDANARLACLPPQVVLTAISRKRPPTPSRLLRDCQRDPSYQLL